MTGVFVTGTDTGVGKTMVVRLAGPQLAGRLLETGSIGDGRRPGCRHRASSGAQAVVHPSAYELAAALSPHEAARLEGVTIGLGAFRLPPTRRPLVVEGAGGALVPLNERELMVDLMTRLGHSVLIVARSGLGTINHALLTIEAFAGAVLTVAGVVMNGPPDGRQSAGDRTFRRASRWSASCRRWRAGLALTTIRRSLAAAGDHAVTDDIPGLDRRHVWHPSPNS